jgi:predicted ArsR family transcriptional regulator
MPASEDTLRNELRDAFRNRAHLYRVLLDELTGELGAARAEAALIRAVERRGREVAAALFADTPADPHAVARRFLQASPDGGDLYPHDVAESADAVTITVHHCPLKEAWTSAALPHAEIATLCRIAGEFDRGLFEAAGVGFQNSTWTAARGGGCCRITLTRRAR